MFNAGREGAQREPIVGPIETQQDALPDEYYVDGDLYVNDPIDPVSQRGATVDAPVEDAARQEHPRRFLRRLKAWERWTGEGRGGRRCVGVRTRAGTYPTPMDCGGRIAHNSLGRWSACALPWWG